MALAQLLLQINSNSSANQQASTTTALSLKWLETIAALTLKDSEQIAEIENKVALLKQE